MGKPKPNSDIQKRRFERVDVRIPATIKIKNDPKFEIAGEILNISEGGAYIQCLKLPPVGSSIVVEIRFMESRQFEAIVAQNDGDFNMPSLQSEISTVRWIQEGGVTKGFGFEFKNLNPETKKFLKTVISYFQNLSRAGVTFL